LIVDEFGAFGNSAFSAGASFFSALGSVIEVI
jgi:hypothetical protein